MLARSYLWRMRLWKTISSWCCWLVLRAAEKLETAGVSAEVIRLLTLDFFPIEKLLPHISGPVIVVEEACTGSGIREAFAWELRAVLPDQRVYGMDLGPSFVPHGAQDKLYKHCGLDEEAIVKLTGEVLKG